MGYAWSYCTYTWHWFNLLLNNMPQVLVWKCPKTSKLFEDQDAYKKHLVVLAQARRKIKHQNMIKNTFFEWLDDQRENVVMNVNDIPEWLMTNQQTIMDAVNAIPGQWASFGDKFADGDLFTKIELERPYWGGNISNSHSCPKGGVQNWGAKGTFADGTPKPTGYPGWSTRINGSLKRNKKNMSSYPASGLFKIVGIHTGTGGGGNESFGWDAKIWAEEWPAAASAITFQKLVDQKFTV